MSVITTGELQKLNFVAEATYGVTPASALSWASDLLEAKDTTDTKRAFNFTSGSRAFVSSTRGMIEAGFAAKGYARRISGAYDWTKFFALYSLGAVGAVTDHLPSFSAVISIKQVIAGATTYQNFLYNGCKINKLEIDGSDPGQPLEFSAEVFGRLPSYSATTAFTGLQTVSMVGYPAADGNTSSMPVCWDGVIQASINGGAYATINPRNWKIIIDNHIQRTPGGMIGADGLYYPVCNLLAEENRDIMVNITIPAENQTFEQAKRLGQTIAMKFTVDTKIITLGGGYFDENDFNQFKQGLNDESLKMHFATITIA